MVTLAKKKKPVPFRKEFTLEKRQQESARLKKKYPDRIPVVVESADNLALDKSKFLVPKRCIRNNKTTSSSKDEKGGGDEKKKESEEENREEGNGDEDFTMGHAIFTIRKRCKLNPEQALFVFVEDASGKRELVAQTELVSSVAKRFTNPDGFLYLYVCKEKTFG